MQASTANAKLDNADWTWTLIGEYPSLQHDSAHVKPRAWPIADRQRTQVTAAGHLHLAAVEALTVATGLQAMDGQTSSQLHAQRARSFDCKACRAWAREGRSDLNTNASKKLSVNVVWVWVWLWVANSVSSREPRNTLGISCHRHTWISCKGFAWGAILGKRLDDMG